MNKGQTTIKVSNAAFKELHIRREVSGVPITVQIEKLLEVKRKDRRYQQKRRTE